MSKPADIGGKRLVSLSPNSWAQWLTQSPEVTFKEMLDSDLQWVSRENDILLKVTSPNTGDFLLLNELQLRYNAKVPRRMRAYSGLVEEKYELPVYPVLVNILPHVSNPQIPTCYESNFQGIRAYQDYKVINLWEVEAQIVFEQNLRSLLPFVPILKGGGEETVVREALRELRAAPPLILPQWRRMRGGGTVALIFGVVCARTTSSTGIYEVGAGRLKRVSLVSADFTRRRADRRATRRSQISLAPSIPLLSLSESRSRKKGDYPEEK